MAQRAPRPCATFGCPALVTAAPRCPAHTKAIEQARGTSTERGYDHRWRAYRLTFLQANPLCVECTAEGLVTAATVVDHRVDHKGDQQLFWDPSNHRAVCKPHHDRRVDAGDFGRVAP